MNKVIELLGDKSCYYLDHTCKTIDKSLIHIPSPDTIDKIWLDSDRNIKVLNLSLIHISFERTGDHACTSASFL